MPVYAKAALVLGLLANAIPLQAGRSSQRTVEIERASNADEGENLWGSVLPLYLTVPIVILALLFVVADGGDNPVSA